jgi:heme/copper-type cytochrome/quinol oxidase subunit 1
MNRVPPFKKKFRACRGLLRILLFSLSLHLAGISSLLGAFNFIRPLGNLRA